MARPPPAFAAASRRVLLVEDDYLVAEDLAHDLEHRGLIVDGPVATCQDALALLVSPRRPDLAILDVRVRDGDVFPLADELERRGIPFVFATAYDPGEVPERFAHVACWQKPVQRSACAAILSDWAAGGEQASPGLPDRSDVRDPGGYGLIGLAWAAEARAIRMRHPETARVLAGITRMLRRLEHEEAEARAQLGRGRPGADGEDDPRLS